MGIHPRLPGLTSDREPAEAIPGPALAAEAGPSRRAFLTKVAVGGAALTVGSQLVPATRLLPVSGAQDGTDGADDGPALDDDDLQIQFLASVALASSAVYRAAVGPDAATALPEPVVVVLRGFGSHHARQASDLVALLPEGTEVAANPSIVAEQTAALDGAADTEAVLAQLRTLSEAVAATHFAALGTLTSQFDARLVAATLPVVAQHATVLGSLGGLPAEELLPAEQGDEGLLTVADHPVGGGGAEEESPGDTTTTTNEGGTGAEPDGEGGTGQPGDGTETGGGGAEDGGPDDGDPTVPTPTTEG